MQACDVMYTSVTQAGRVHDVKDLVKNDRAHGRVFATTKRRLNASARADTHTHTHTHTHTRIQPLPVQVLCRYFKNIFLKLSD